MPDGACADVHAFADGHACVTCWMPTPEERAAIAAGGPVWLSCYMGGTMPPVAVFGLTPFIAPPTTERIEEIADGAASCMTCIHFTGEVNAMGNCGKWNRPVPFHYHCSEHTEK